jgi:hypothetical protein
VRRQLVPESKQTESKKHRAQEKNPGLFLLIFNGDLIDNEIELCYVLGKIRE